ncbi:TetR family transcriptional regulator [Nonomuraea sp. KC401]|uniref:TetR/AcrR family transcriptional regulator n=1 Tax=unclassified Nonomuraea TaxID=2593643 RepID=UPI0010FE20EC|nr:MULTISPECIES: TetR family transcriptional regulator C-terminal domain-containing protein [unclassified Nonomuraea]NBE95805.1 TetR family transcriptional regulator [Nonomuraea sp. K271]TLF71307.1 TetR family transcriptional regulator [Nonomuraea sp. KC401]
MPKIVDHEQRREEIVRVVWQVVSSEGIEGATVRKVAEAAGISVGGLRHYFDSQRGLLLFAAEAVARSVTRRITARYHADMPGERRARLMLEELLPLDDERRVEVDVWLACLLRSHVDESLARLRHTGWVGERHICRLAIASCHGLPLPDRPGQELARADLERQAGRLHVFIDGLTLHAATYPDRFTPQSVRRMLHDELRLLTGTPTPA